MNSHQRRTKRRLPRKSAFRLGVSGDDMMAGIKKSVDVGYPVHAVTKMAMAIRPPDLQPDGSWRDVTDKLTMWGYKP